MNQVKKITAIISFIITALLILLEIVFMLFVKPQGYTYVHGLMGLIISVFAMIFAIFPLWILIQSAKQRWVIAIIILLVNLIHVFMGCDFTSTSIVSYGKDMEHPIAVRVQGQRVYIMENTRFLFGKIGTASAIPMKDENSVTWITKDTGVFTYRGIDDKLHIHVSSYGDAKTGSYYNVAPELQGVWKHKDKTWTIDSGNISIDRISFENNQMEQVGKSAIVLKDELGSAQYVIALGDNFKFNDNGYAKKGSDIVLWKVSLDKEGVTYTKADKEISLNSEESPKEVEKKEIDNMKATLKKDPSLSNYETPYGYVNVKDTSDDMMWIARQIMYTDDTRPDVGEGCSNDVTVKGASILAQKKNDYYLTISTTQTATCGIDSETMDIHWRFRVIKYQDGYFAYRITYDENGYYKLKKLKTPITLTSDGSDNYHYFIQK